MLVATQEVSPSWRLEFEQMESEAWKKSEQKLAGSFCTSQHYSTATTRAETSDVNCKWKR